MLLHRKSSGKWLIVIAIGGLYILSTPWIGTALRGQLESRPMATALHAQPAQAIVILGGGCLRNAPEYGGDTVTGDTLERLRWGARLHKMTGLPILTSGGKTPGLSIAEGELMRSALAEDFQVPVRWVEDSALNTFENASRARQILAPDRIHRILLVTHAWHMARAEYTFRQAGFQVVPAPTSFQSIQRLDPLSFVASMAGLKDSCIFFHEAIGLLWYRLRFALGATTG